MFSSGLKLYHAPIDGELQPDVGHLFVPPYAAREYDAHANGEGASRYGVLQFYGETVSNATLPLPPADDLVIIAKDGRTECSLPSLMRRYHFFDDFFSAFPDNKEIEVPFSLAEVNGAVYLVGNLSDCLECMQYFNPKKPDEYFQLDFLGSISDEVLLGLVDDLTEDDLADMIEGRDYDMSSEDNFVPLPRGGQDRPALACILESYSDVERQLRMFSHYPSYLCAIIHDEDVYAELLLRSDFSQSKEWYVMRSGVISASICIALGIVENREDAAYLLAMLGIRRRALGNLDKKVIAPYHAKFDSMKMIEEIRMLPNARQNIANLFNWSYGELIDVMEGSD